MRERALFDISRPRRTKATDPEPLIEQLVACGVPRPLEEFQFAKQLFGRNFAFDLSWPDPWRIALEIEGGMFGGRVVNAGAGAFEYRRKHGVKVHVPIPPGTILRLGGRHNTGEGLRRDLEKYELAAMLGWLLLKAMPDDIKTGDVPAKVQRAFSMRQRYCPLAGHTDFPTLTFTTPAPPAMAVHTSAQRERRGVTASPVPW